MTTPAASSATPALLRFVRSPFSNLPFTIDWTQDLDIGDTIATSEWAAVEPNITVESTSLSATTTTVWLTGGTVPIDNLVGVNYHAVNTITTNGGCTDERTVILFTKPL